MSYVIDTPVIFGSGTINFPGLATSAVVQIDGGNNLTTGTVSLTSQVSGILPASNGGTGTLSSPGDGEVPVGNGGVYTPTTISSGTGINVASSAGAIQVSNTGVTSLGGTANQIAASV